MCGGFVCFYSGSANPDASLIRAHALYNVGRLISYVLLGAIAGAVGQGVTHLGALSGLSNLATIASGVLMIAWGVSALVRQHRSRTATPFSSTSTAPLAIQKLLGNLLRSVREQPVAMRAAVTGLVTTLIPCGWLYVFVVAAAGTGSARNGMLLMAIFWLGNVPALVAVGVGAQHLFGPFRKRLPALSAVTVVFMGALAITGHLLFTTAQHHGR